jgi:hypothetical protein
MHAITVGCGSGNGKVIIDTLLQQGYHVTNIGSSRHDSAVNIEIDWANLQIPDLHKLCKFDHAVDFVFFNQNASSLDWQAFDFEHKQTLEIWKLLKNWQHSYWISCQLPFLLIYNLKKNLHAQSKLGWMLSDYMICDSTGADKFPDYSSQKYFNYLAMKCFSSHYQTFGIMPDFSMHNSMDKLQNIIELACNQTVTNTVFKFKEKME